MQLTEETTMVTIGNGDVLDTEIGSGHRSDPAAARNHFESATRLEDEGDRAGAITELRAAVDAGNDPHHRFRLAYLLDLVGEEDQATDLLEQLSDVKQPSINVLLNLAVLYEDSGEVDAAEKCLKQILDTDPNHERARLYMRDVRASRDMYYDEDQARDAAKRAALLNTPVTDFELTVRSRNCLKKMNIRTLGDLLKISESELMGYKNFGETSLLEIKQMVVMKGLRLGQDVEGQFSRLHQDRYAELQSQAPEQVLNKPVSALELSVRCRKAIQLLNIQTVGDLAVRTEAELMGIKNFGATSLQEIKERLAEHGLELRDLA
jgi:DNA-directed RNA polymerase subunit alpha